MDFETFETDVSPSLLDRVEMAGAAALTDEELIASVLGARQPRFPRGESARGRDRSNETARRVLRRAGSLRTLASWSLAEIAAIPGIGARRAQPLAAAIELGRRTAHERKSRGQPIGGAAEIYRHYRPILRDERRELFLAALLDVKYRLIRDVRVTEGSLSQTMVHPREAFAEAVREPAYAVIFVHNHPSGDVAPSNEDLAITRRLVAAGDALGIPVLDHVILGEEDWYSFAEAGRLRT